MKRLVNPDWEQYNRFFNEGGEGYNPYPHFIGDPHPLSREPLDCTSAPMGEHSGHAISRSEATFLLHEESRLLADAELRARCGDFSAAASIDKIKLRVAHYTKQLL